MAKWHGDYHEATMSEAVEFMSKRTILPVGQDDHDFRVPGKFESCIRFTDGSEVSCQSKWSGPYSEVTPDIDADPPIFYIFDPNVVRYGDFAYKHS